LGLPEFQSDYDAANNVAGRGSIWLMYGSKQIPVHLNPQFADVVNIPQVNGAGITLLPNPANQWSVATIVWPEAEEADYKIYNLLGNVMQTGKIQMLGGAEQIRLYFQNLPSGVYVIEVQGSSGEARAKLVIAR
jgi:Secretion system C-terminal sorting domain